MLLQWLLEILWAFLERVTKLDWRVYRDFRCGIFLRD
jgi:hypothetical protein